MSPAKADSARGAASPSFLASWREYRRFRKLPRESRAIVFYSESRQDWHHFEPIIERMTGEHGRTVCYLTSDAGDPGLARRDERLLGFFMRKGLLRTALFQVVDADVFVLTMMDLGNFELRRSLHPVHYVYLFHSLGSTHMADHANSYDHYDTILCAGPHHLREIRRREELVKLPAKRLVEHGYARLEELLAERTERPARAAAGPADAAHRSHLGRAIAAQRVRRAAGRDPARRRPPRDPAPALHDGAHQPRADREDRAPLRESPALRVHGPHGRDGVAVSAPTSWCATGRRWRSSGGSASRSRRCSSTCPRGCAIPSGGRSGSSLSRPRSAPRSGLWSIPLGSTRLPALIDKLLADPERFRAKAASLRAQAVFNLGRSAEVAAAEIVRLADEHAGERKKTP